MADVREWVDGSKTVRVDGLDAKWPSLGAAQFELEMMLSGGLAAANEALRTWRGRHAATFVEDANELFRRFARLVQKVMKAKRILMLWPVRPGRPPLDEENAASARVEVTDEAGTAAADPDKLDAFRVWCEGVCAGLPSLAGAVNLEGITADVTRPVPVLTGRFGNDFGLLPPFGPLGLLDEPEPATPGEAPAETETETTAADPALYIDLPDVSGRTTTVVDLAGQLGAWAGVVAVAFREGDSRLISFITAHPDLADELLAGFRDHRLSGESSLVILLAYFDLFDKASGGGEDGEVSLDDLRMMASRTDVPPYVARAATLLMTNQTLFNLVETMNDGGKYARDIVGWNGDGKISVEDIETFLEFNDHQAVMEQNFDAFDTAAHPDTAADGEITPGDLEALAEGDNQLAESATWLLAHNDAWSRLIWYEPAKQGFPGAKSGDRPITASSLVLLAVDQQVYADHPNQAAGFVDRRFDMLMDAPIGNLADPVGMGAVFDSALTASDQKAALMDRVITEVATDGTIHNSALNLAFANGAAANMPLLDTHINALYHRDLGPVLPESGTEEQQYLNTHDFLREVSRDPTAATRLRDAVFDYGLAAVPNAPAEGEARDLRMADLGRIQALVDVAQDNALTGDALHLIHDVASESGLGPSMGSSVDYGISHVPAGGTINDIADGMGISVGDGVDWLLHQFGVESEDAFNSLSEAEKADKRHRLEGAINQAVWLATDLYATDVEVRAAAQGQPFVGSDGALTLGGSDDAKEAFREWAVSLTADGQPARADYDSIGSGTRDVLYPPHGISLEERR